MTAGEAPLAAPRRSQQMAHRLQRLRQSGVLLTALSEVQPNPCFHGGRADKAAAIPAAKAAEAQ